MELVDDSLKAQRAVLAAMLVGSAALFWRASLDIFNLTKATFVVSGAVLLVALSAVRAAWTRRIVVPVSPVLWLVGAFVAALVVSTLVSDVPAVSFMGQWGRYTGLVPYLTYALVLLLVVRLYAARSVAPLVKAVLVALGLVAGYGMLQVLGKDPLHWDTFGLDGIFSSLGNTNFASGYVGITVPVAVWSALSGSLGLRWRVYSAVLAVVSAIVLVKTTSFQGPVVAVAGTGVLALVILLDGERLPSPLRRVPALARGGVALVLIAAVAVVGTALLGGLRGNLGGGMQERRYLWQAALSIFADHPIFGTGLDTYADHFSIYRPAAHADWVEFGTADAPHNVPLGMFSNGGLLLGAAYLAIVVYTGWVLVRGLVRLRGEQRLLLGGLGGAWVAYQLQSLVSFDLPPLALLHWALAGAIIAVAAPPELREWMLPGKPVVRSRRGRGPLVVPGSTRSEVAAVALITVLALWLVSRPLRADIAARDATRLIVQGRVTPALASFERSSRLAPWEAVYWLRRASAFEMAKMPSRALEADERAAELEPHNSLYAAFAARLSKQLGDQDRASRWYHEAVRRDPRHLRLIVEAADFEKELGRPEQAVALLERAVKVRDDVRTWLALAKAHSAAGAAGEARRAYERVLQLEPGNAVAQRALAKNKGVANG